MDNATTLVFAGILISLLITIIKSKVKTGTTGSMLIVVGISLIGSAAYTALTHFGYWDAFLKIITIAGAFYAYIIKNVKDAASAADAKNA